MDGHHNNWKWIMNKSKSKNKDFNITTFKYNNITNGRSKWSKRKSKSKPNDMNEWGRHKYTNIKVQNKKKKKIYGDEKLRNCKIAK